MKKNNYYLIIDSIRVGNIEDTLKEYNYEYGYLYSDTEWASQIKLSPFWIKVTPGCYIWNEWNHNESWGSSGIIYQYVNTSHPKVIKKFKSNITTYSDDGKLYLIRYYSPKLLSSVLKKLPEYEINRFTYNANRIYISESSPHKVSTNLIFTPDKTNSNKTNRFTQEIIKELII